MAETTHRSNRIALAALCTGLVGVIFGVFVGLAPIVEDLSFFSHPGLRVIPYLLGAGAMVLAVVALVAQHQLRLGSIAFAVGLGAVLVGPFLLYALLALCVAIVLVVVIGAISQA